MCGIVGFFLANERWATERSHSVVSAMAATIAHRGPDDEGIWGDKEHGLGLGHRRLSIVDLTTSGHQPMLSADGRYVIVFNGEIYNHLDLRADLEKLGCRFRSSSDTEVLIEAVAHWGIQKTCERLVGMFAFAVWDRVDRRLWLARDRLGKKPLYLYRDPRGNIAFASELKALWQFPDFNPSLRNEALAQYVSYSYVPEHLSIFNEVDKVLPGSIVELSPGKAPVTRQYWSLAEAAARGISNRIVDPAEAEESLLTLLRDATGRRMLADVPLGAFLSGGIDSGLVVSLMQEQSAQKVRTFSIGFRDAAFDEAPVARAVAAHLGTDHTELYVTDSEAQEIVPKLPDIFDEPFADASQIPTYLLASLTRKEVTVALTGDGGDESFGGYLRYRNQSGLVGKMYALPRPLRNAIATGIGAVPAGFWTASSSLIPSNRRPRFLASKVAKVARAMKLDNAADRGKAYLSFWTPEQLLVGSRRSALDDPFGAPSSVLGEPSESMQFWETLHYLPGDLLAKLDRATMAASLEARSPLLDHRVVELAWQLPPAMKASPQGTKRILRNLLFKYVPRDLVDLPKQGFSVPIGSWMTGNLREWVETSLSYGRHNLAEVFNWQEVDAAWRNHLAGLNGYVEKLWIIVVFCVWHQRWMEQSRLRGSHA
ncbi:MAG: asparagine synthase (glutamine-hydrolyzing) [Pseudomonadota bacterium]